jgi:hypothetical protein
VNDPYSYLIFSFCRGAKTITLGNIVLLWLLLEAIACCSIGTFCSRNRSNIKLVKNRFCDENEFVFEKVRENLKMFDNITQVTKYFKRYDLNKYMKMIRGKQVTKYFKRCGLKKIRENNTRKTSNVSFQTLWFEKILQNEMFLLCHPHGKQATLNFSSVVACAICEKKIIIKKLHFLNMIFFQCLIIILEKCLSLYTDLIFF